MQPHFSHSRLQAEAGFPRLSEACSGASEAEQKQLLAPQVPQYFRDEVFAERHRPTHDPIVSRAFRHRIDYSVLKTRTQFQRAYEDERNVGRRGTMIDDKRAHSLASKLLARKGL